VKASGLSLWPHKHLRRWLLPSSCPVPPGFLTLTRYHRCSRVLAEVLEVVLEVLDPDHPCVPVALVVRGAVGVVSGSAGSVFRAARSSVSLTSV